ncbi:MAG TPA: enoyl-CoA hydratase [Steroidobacteraceae bacterium]|jgi:enoyl-CoA hydratase/carnithine racemase|nr:enoyl-CoA hydratase [Steroidobacteraceae bacterium]
MSIRTAVANGVLTLEIARPEKKNALTIAMYEAMTQALEAAQADKDVRAVLIMGQPAVFTAGNDLQDFLQRPPVAEDSAVLQFMHALLKVEKPIVAAVTGAAVGIGVTMLLHCDLVYVSEDAQLSMPFVSLGLVPEFGSSEVLPRLLGPVKAAELLLLGKVFSGADAVRFGIANAALPATEVSAHARRVAERFNELPAGAVRDAKRLMRVGTKEQVLRAIRDEATVFAERLRSPEAKEAMAAFLQKRKADFSRF